MTVYSSALIVVPPKSRSIPVLLVFLFLRKYESYPKSQTEFFNFFIFLFSNSFITVEPKSNAPKSCDLKCGYDFFYNFCLLFIIP